MVETFDLDGVQAVLGYKFKNTDLLVSALTHSSYANEHPDEANERLEFLGDCVLNFLVGVEFYSRDKSASEGILSSQRSACVSRTPLAGLVKQLGLLDYLRVGAGVNKSAFSDKAQSDVYEAALGAIYLDGGLDECKRFLDKTFFSSVQPTRDYKTELQILAVSRGDAPVYVTFGKDGGFNSELTVLGQRFLGYGKTKRAAEISAAKLAVSEIDKNR